MSLGTILHGGSHRVCLATSAGATLYPVLWGDLWFLAEAKLNNFWQLVVDEKKQIFTSEKFLLLASEEGEFLGLWRVFRQDLFLSSCLSSSLAVCLFVF